MRFGNAGVFTKQLRQFAGCRREIRARVIPPPVGVQNDRIWRWSQWVSRPCLAYRSGEGMASKQQRER
jgi:hypothetical protein